MAAMAPTDASSRSPWPCRRRPPWRSGERCRPVSGTASSRITTATRTAPTVNPATRCPAGSSLAARPATGLALVAGGRRPGGARCSSRRVSARRDPLLPVPRRRTDGRAAERRGPCWPGASRNRFLALVLRPAGTAGPSGPGHGRDGDFCLLRGVHPRQSGLWKTYIICTARWIICAAWPRLGAGRQVRPVDDGHQQQPDILARVGPGAGRSWARLQPCSSSHDG